LGDNWIARIRSLAIAADDRFRAGGGSFTDGPNEELGVRATTVQARAPRVIIAVVSGNSPDERIANS
jgi:hypothetical protein